jgi:AbiV family abortive infection protein
MVRKPPVIPTRLLLKGCYLCLGNALIFAKEADLILRKGFRQHAFGLVILGFQELGKFGILLDNYVQASNHGGTQVSVTGFYSHNIKMEARMKHYRDSEEDLKKSPDAFPWAELPTTKEERYWKKIFESASFKKSVKALERNGEAARLAATYVDYDEVSDRWISTRSPSKDIVEAHRRLLATEVIALGLTLRIKSPEVTLMAWKAQGLN